MVERSAHLGVRGISPVAPDRIWERSRLEYADRLDLEIQTRADKDGANLSAARSELLHTPASGVCSVRWASKTEFIGAPVGCNLINRAACTNGHHLSPKLPNRYSPQRISMPDRQPSKGGQIMSHYESRVHARVITGSAPPE